MHVRESSVSRAGKTYRYAQLVQSYRRPDGMPAHRVVAHLGSLSDQQIANFKLALKAGRSGQALVAATPRAPKPAAHVVLDNLAYLDVAVALALWREWGLSQLLAELLPDSDGQISPAEVVCALTIQRCIDPGSKLYAQRWFPRTALPELLGIAPGRFNNTRLHRVLAALDEATASLQQRLPLRYLTRQAAFASLFLDVTDTWFVGRGPPLAEVGKTKEGMFQRKVGIVLLCSEQGLPLRWEVIPGRQSDGEAMGGLLEAVSQVSWVRDTPVVFDRAMGRTAYLTRVGQTGIRFVCALTVDEYEAYTDRIPHGALGEVSVSAPEAIAKAAEAVEKAGLRKVKDDLFILDLGVLERRDELASASSVKQAEVGSDQARLALEHVDRMKADLDAGRVANQREAGLRYGLKRNLVAKYMGLLRLPEDVLQVVRSGKAAGVTLRTLLRLAAMTDREAQRASFEEELRLAQQAPHRHGKRGLTRPSDPSPKPPDPLRLRGVACFNPELFVNQRDEADKTLARIHSFVRELNERLVSTTSRKQQAVYAEVDRELRRRDLLGAFDVVIEEDGAHLKVAVHLKAAEWQRRHRYDGFNLVVAHPEIQRDASDIARLYRAKDAVEQDFHIIKSAVQLRPVRHRTDPKVRAHVTLCMLALLLERSLETRLPRTADGPRTASAVFELLSNIHLNRIQPEGGDTPAYTVTRPSDDHRALLASLGLEPLTDDAEIAAKITPR